MKVVSWNMAANTTSKDRGVHDRVWETLLTLEPDISLLQEAMAPPPGLLIDDRVVGLRAARKWDSAIYSPLLNVADARALEEVAAHGQATVARVQLADREIWLANVHASTRDAVVPHLRAITAALEQCFAGSFILAGDFNSCRLADEWYPGYQHLDFFEELEARLTNCHQRVHNQEAQSFFADGYPPFQNDHIFVSTDIEVGSCDVLPHDPFRGLSDHAPIVAHLTLGGSES